MAAAGQLEFVFFYIVALEYNAIPHFLSTQITLKM